MKKYILNVIVAGLFLTTMAQAENLIYKRDMGMACDIFKSFQVESFVDFKDLFKELNILKFDENTIPHRFSDASLTLNQEGVLYAQQTKNLYTVSLSSLNFWKLVVTSQKFNKEEMNMLSQLYTAGFIFDEQDFFQNLKEAIKEQRKRQGYTKFRTITSGFYFLEKILTNRGSSSIKSADFQNFIEAVVLGNNNEAVKILTDENGIFKKNLKIINQKCEEVQ